MTKRTGNFFDLSSAAQVCRRMAEQSSLGIETDPFGAPVPGFVRPQSVDADVRQVVQDAENATELWERLIAWSRRDLNAEGVFALDQYGFVIASNSADSALPGEIFSAAFSETRRLLETYIHEDGVGGLKNLELGLDKLGNIHITERESLGTTVLFCVWSRRKLKARAIERSWREIAQAVDYFDRLRRVYANPEVKV